MEENVSAVNELSADVLDSDSDYRNRKCVLCRELTKLHEEIIYGEKLEGKIVKVMNTPTKRGYGFIVSGTREFVKFFFHWSALRQGSPNFNELTVGMRVSFIETKTSRGNRAVQIDVLG